MWDYGADNRGPEMAAVSIAMAVVSVIAVALRSYTMAKLLKRFLFEDLLAVITCLLQCAFCILVVIGVSYGLGAHVDNVPEVNRPKALVFKWAGQVAYIVVSTLVKFVVGIFLLRLCVNNNWQRLTIIILLVVVGLFNIFYVFLAIFQCQPVAFYWYRYEPNAPVTGKCNGHALATIPTYFAVLIGIVSDLILALLPATLIKGANLDRRTKISVCCVLALGSLASVATIARIPYAKQLLSNPDYLYNFTDLAIWSIVECGIAITASSLATLRPLFIKMKLLASSHFTSRYGGGSGLPMQSVRSGPITVISSRHAKRSTSMTGTTAMTGSTAVTGATGGLTSVKEFQDGGIQVEKEFEMSVITRENSEDSIDRLEAEINEVIRPGTAKRKASQDRYSSRRNSLTPRPRPAPLQTSFEDAAVTTPGTTTTISAGSSTSSGLRFTAHNTPPTSASSQRPRRLSNGFIRNNSFSQSPRTPTSTYSGIGSAYTDTVVRSPPPTLPTAPLLPTPTTRAPSSHHQHSHSEDALLQMQQQQQQQTPGSSALRSFSPPSFHLPTRMHHQSGMSTQSVMSTATSQHSRRTFGDRQSRGLSPPPRLTQTSMGDFTPSNINTTNINHHNNNNNNNSPFASPLGSPVNIVTARYPAPNNRSTLGSSPASPTSPTNASPVSGVRFPFQRPVAASASSSNASASYNTNITNNNHNHNNYAAPPSSRSHKKTGKQRISAFLADETSSSSSAASSTLEMEPYHHHTLEEMDESPSWTQRPQEESPSPLRSHPPLSPKGNWV